MIQGLKAAHVIGAVVGLGVIGGGALALSLLNRDEPESIPGTSTWTGREGSLKNVTRVNGTRDANDGAWNLETRHGYEDVKAQGSKTSDGFRAAVQGSRSVNRTIDAIAGGSGAFSGKVTTMQREFNDSGSKVETTLTKALFETTAQQDGSWTGTVKLADSDEKIEISGSIIGNEWSVAIDEPENPYIPHREFTGTGPITVPEQLAIAVSYAT